MVERFGRAQEILKNKELDALLVTNESDIFYLSGFRTSDFILVFTNDESILVTDSRYTLIARDSTSGFDILECNNGLIPFVKNLLAQKGCKRVGIQDCQLTLNDYNAFTDDCDINYVMLGDVFKTVRAVKDAAELDKIVKAQEITDSAFEYMLSYIKRGQTELEISLELEFYMRKKGAQRLSFDSIVASGPNSAKPHAVPENRVLREGDMLTLDFGCVVDGYCSDMTRTIAIGEPGRQMRDIYDIVLQAHNLAKKELRPGRSTKEIDAIARDHIATCGYGKYFGHGLGHGVGIDIHELPVLSYRSDVILQKGNVVTIEPGIYLPDVGGVRIENMCYITDDGYCDITKSDNKLIII